MNEPFTPQDIARRTFDVARRGYEQQEVRGFLHEVSALMERQHRTEVELRERAERAESRLAMVDEPDEATLLEVLGEETTRVLTSAREAAAEIRRKAEEAAARMIDEATTSAAEIRAEGARGAEELRASVREENEALLESARTELDRRRAEAQEEAVRLAAEAQAAMATQLEESRAEVERARQESDAEREAARQEGRAMVAEAQQVRERMLRDLAVRRKRARQQVEKLNAGRERLLQAYDVVRRTTEEATNELTMSLIDARIAADAAGRRVDQEREPTLEQLDEEVTNAGLAEVLEPDDLGGGVIPQAPDGSDDPDDETPGPFSGEVPVVEAPREEGVLITGPAADADDRDDRYPAGFDDDRRGRKRRRKVFDGLPVSKLAVIEPHDANEGVVRLLTASDVSSAEAAPPSEAPGMDAADEPAPATDLDAAQPAGRHQRPDAEDPDQERRSSPPATRSADALFARLREHQADEDASPAPSETFALVETDGSRVEEPAAPGVPDERHESAGSGMVAAAEPEGDIRPFSARRAAAGSVEKDLARRLKRALADEQNEVLDLLRRVKPKAVHDLLPKVDEHAGRWAETVEPPLRAAAAAGAAWSGGQPSPVTDLADELARSLVSPLRERIERSFTASDGNLDDVADRVRALYREWKGPRLSDTTAHFVGAAYARGVLDGTAPGAPVRWVVDPAAGPCPDCDDNVLAGIIAKGDEFPTGNVAAPAHPGCHCLVLPAGS